MYFGHSSRGLSITAWGGGVCGSKNSSHRSDMETQRGPTHGEFFLLFYLGSQPGSRAAQTQDRFLPLPSPWEKHAQTHPEVCFNNHPGVSQAPAADKGELDSD